MFSGTCAVCYHITVWNGLTLLAIGGACNGPMHTDEELFPIRLPFACQIGAKRISYLYARVLDNTLPFPMREMHHT